MNSLKLWVNSDNSVCLGVLFEELWHKTPSTFLVVFILPPAAGSETTMTSSSGQTFQITGTSVGGKVVTTKLSVPANSKIVTVNVPTSQGGMAALSVFILYCFLWPPLSLVCASPSALLSAAHIPNFVAMQRGTTGPTQTRVAVIASPKLLNFQFSPRWSKFVHYPFNVNETPGHIDPCELHDKWNNACVFVIARF